MLNNQANKFYLLLQKRYSRRINLDLRRIKSALKLFNNLHLNFKEIINVIGSDGKNSVCVTLKFILEEYKKSISIFLSPALTDFRERFYFDGKNLTLKEIKKYVKIINKANLKLTLFEVLTLIFIFAREKRNHIDYTIIEAGAGFSKDSTNLWSNPQSQIICNINFQHSDLFKVKTLKEICKIKVGSLAQNTNIYIGKQETQTLKIIRSILKKNSSKIFYYGSDWIIKKNKGGYRYIDKFGYIDLISKNIRSDGLWQNIGCAVKVARNMGIPNKVIYKAISKVVFQGRVQYIKKGNLRKFLKPNEKLLLDGCHSIKAAKNLAKYLKSIKGPKYAIWAIQKNREPKKFIECFQGIFRKIVCIKVPNEKNFCSAEDLKKIAQSLSVESLTAKNINDALTKISSHESKEIILMGSLYTMGEALKLN